MDEYEQYCSPGVFGNARTADKLAAMAHGLSHFPKDRGLNEQERLRQGKQLEYILLRSRAKSSSNVRQSLGNVANQAEKALLRPLDSPVYSGERNLLSVALRTLIAELIPRVEDLLLADPVHAKRSAARAKAEDIKLQYPLPPFECERGQQQFIKIIKSTPGPQAAHAVQFLEESGRKHGCDHFKDAVSTAGLDIDGQVQSYYI